MVECAKCGSCCRYYLIQMGFRVNSDEEDYLQRHGTIFNEKARSYLVMQKCSCLREIDNLCCDYKTRPEVCKQFKVGGLECRRARELFGLSPL